MESYMESFRHRVPLSRVVFEHKRLGFSELLIVFTAPLLLKFGLEFKLCFSNRASSVSV